MPQIGGPDRFYPGFYLALNPDVARDPNYGSMNGAKAHFHEHGLREGRAPSIFFSPKWYLRAYDDVRNQWGERNYVGAMIHWSGDGISEGRIGSPLFDWKYYLQQNPDVANSDYGRRGPLGAYEHYICYGYQENRLTTPTYPNRGLFLEGNSVRVPAEMVRYLVDDNPIVEGNVLDIIIEIEKIVREIIHLVEIFKELFGGSNDRSRIEEKNKLGTGDVIVPGDGSLDLPGRDPDRPVA